MKRFQPSNIYCAWDKKIGDEKSLRHQLNDSYKGTRDKERNEEVNKAGNPVRELLELLGIKNIYPCQGEADDIIAFLSRDLPGENTIASADTDFYQLINNKTVVYNLVRDIICDEQWFINKFDFAPRYYILYKAIVGDKSDNIEGIKGYGPKKATAVVKGDLKLSKEQQDIVKSNLELISLTHQDEKWHGEMYLYESQINCQNNQDYNKFLDLCAEYDLKSVEKDKHDWYNMFFQRNNMVDIMGMLK